MKDCLCDVVRKLLAGHRWSPPRLSSLLWNEPLQSAFSDDSWQRTYISAEGHVTLSLPAPKATFRLGNNAILT